jgi:hypothetical protein
MARALRLLPQEVGKSGNVAHRFQGQPLETPARHGQTADILGHAVQNRLFRFRQAGQGAPLPVEQRMTRHVDAGQRIFAIGAQGATQAALPIDQQQGAVANLQRMNRAGHDFPAGR